MCTIRKMTKEDISLCGDIYIKAFHGKIDEYLEEKYSDIAVKMREALQFSSYFSGFIDDDDKYAYCFLYKDKVVGYLTALEIPSLMDDKTIFIDNLAVTPEYQQKGIGTKGLNEFIGMFPETCAKKLLTEKKRPAYKFYKKNGFRDMEMKVMESSQVVDVIIKLEKENKRLKKEIKEAPRAIENRLIGEDEVNE